jgi:hypothetical protein
VQYDAEEAVVDRQAPGIAIVDETEPPELVHEVTDARTGCADHPRQVILADPGKNTFGPAFLAKVRQQQEDPRQTPLA